MHLLTASRVTLGPHTYDTTPVRLKGPLEIENSLSDVKLSNVPSVSSAALVQLVVYAAITVVMLVGKHKALWLEKQT